MTSDQAIVAARFPNAKINWSRTAVEVRDGAVILGSTRMVFMRPYLELEAAAWADAAARIASDKAGAQ